MNFKNIHIGKIIEIRVSESQIDISRICNFFHLEEQQIQQMYEAEDIAASDLLKWSKLLKYDFFRLYCQHLILYSPSCSINHFTEDNIIKSNLPKFRKHIYTKEVIEFILEMIDKGQKTRLEVIEEYRIPKTTLYKWISKKASSNAGSLPLTSSS